MAVDAARMTRTNPVVPAGPTGPTVANSVEFMHHLIFPIEMLAAAVVRGGFSNENQVLKRHLKGERSF